MAKAGKITLIVVSCALVIANIVIIATGNHSMSRVIQDTAGKFLIIPFGAGVLCGHWFWPIRRDK